MADPRPLGIRLLAAAGSNLMVLAARTLVTLLVTPITFRALGRFDYGIWEIMVSAAGYMSLFDIGLRPSVSRFVTLYSTQRSGPELREALSTAWVFMLLLGGLGFIVFSCWGLVWLVHPPQVSAYEWRYCAVLLIIGCQVAILFPSMVAESALEGFQAYGAKSRVTLVLVAVGGVITVTWIRSFDALLFVATVNTLALALKGAVFFRMVRARLPGVPVFSLRAATMQCYRRMVAFGSKSFLQGVGEDIVSLGPAMIIGGVLGPATVPLYRLPAAVTDYARLASWTAAYAFMTFFVELDASGDQTRVQRTYLVGSRLAVAQIMPVAIIILVLGAPFIGRWISPNLGSDAQPLIPWVVLIYLSPLLCPIGVHYLTALAKHGGIAVVGVVLSIVGVVAGALAAPHFGLVGFAACVALAVLLKVPYRIWISCRALGLPVSRYLTAILWPVLPCAMVQYLAMRTLAGRWEETTWPALIATGLAGTGVYLVAFLALASRDDRQLLREALGHFLAAVRRRPAAAS